MTAGDRLGLAAEAQARVARVIALLERPTAAALDRTSAELTAAIAGMKQLEGELALNPVAYGSKPLIAALRRDLKRAGLLLRNAWELRIGRAGPFSYTRKGELVPEGARQARWTLEA